MLEVQQQLARHKDEARAAARAAETAAQTTATQHNEQLAGLQKELDAARNDAEQQRQRGDGLAASLASREEIVQVCLTPCSPLAPPQPLSPAPWPPQQQGKQLEDRQQQLDAVRSHLAAAQARAHAMEARALDAEREVKHTQQHMKVMC